MRSGRSEVLETASTRSRQKVRSEDDGDAVLYGLAAPFGSWTRIESSWEGPILERVAAGAFRRTLAERGDEVKVLFDHGQDPTIGSKPLGRISVLEERTNGLFYEVELSSTSYNQDLAALLGDGLLGASFRFRIVHEQMDLKPARSRHNPDRLPERTLKDVDLFELGPVAFPAYQDATAGLRSEIVTASRPGRGSASHKRTLSGRGLVTPIRKLPTGTVTLRPGFDRLALSHPAVKADPRAFVPADGSDTQTRALHRQLVARSRPFGQPRLGDGYGRHQIGVVPARKGAETWRLPSPGAIRPLRLPR
jgi:HK97 family phage prohead protease